MVVDEEYQKDQNEKQREDRDTCDDERREPICVQQRDRSRDPSENRREDQFDGEQRDSSENRSKFNLYTSLSKTRLILTIVSINPYFIHNSIIFVLC